MKHIYILLFSILALSGCVAVELGGTDEPAADGPTVVFSLVSGNQHVATRATTPGEDSYNENVVDRLDVFFFSQSGECLFYPEASQVSKTGTTVKINIPEATANVLFTADFRLYVVANSILPRDELEGKTYGQLIKTVHGVAQEFNPGNPVSQPYFLMDGILPISGLTTEMTNLGEITLVRAAAKIKVRITAAAVAGYSPVSAGVRIDNSLEKTALGQEAPLYAAQAEDYAHSEYRPVWIPGSTDAEFDTAPFYSYANDWEYGDMQETYITIRVKWYKDGGGAEPKDYYYRLPFNYVIPDSDDKFCLKRNHIYTFGVNIGVLGGLDPDEMVDLTPDFEIKDWTTHNIIARLSQYDYLVVAETDVQMHDVATRSIHYTSSQPVSVSIDSVYHYTYLSTGEIRLDEVLPGDDRYPVIAPNEDTNQIEISSPVPVNYVPLMMRFKVMNTKGLYHNVRVIQYPRQYITSEYSDWNDIDFSWYKEQGRTYFWSNNGNGGTDMQNFNLYTVTTTSMDPGDEFSIGGNFTHLEKSDADFGATINVTNQDEATNNMVSPQFVIASQRGITDTNTSYSSAQVRCNYYMEGGYGRGTWRMPTLAEMKLISRLQRDGNSAITELFKPSSSGHGKWWVARIDGTPGYLNSYYYSVKVMTGEVVKELYVPGSTTASVRCVRDVWKN